MSLVLHDFNVLRTPGDGHCLLHSITGSWLHQIVHAPPPSMDSIKCHLFIEAINNSSKYMSFLPNISKASYIRQLRAYVIRKSYDNVFGDLVPTIVANALAISIRIFDIEANGSPTTLVINPDPTPAKFQISIHRSNDHYSILSHTSGHRNHPATHRLQSWPMGSSSPDTQCTTSHRQHTWPMVGGGDDGTHRLQPWPMSRREPPPFDLKPTSGTTKHHAAVSTKGVHRLQPWPMNTPPSNVNASPGISVCHRQHTWPMTDTENLPASRSQSEDQNKPPITHRLQSWPMGSNTHATSTSRITYDRESLLALRPTNSKIKRDVRKILFKNQIWLPQNHKSPVADMYLNTQLTQPTPVIQIQVYISIYLDRFHVPTSSIKRLKG